MTGVLIGVAAVFVAVAAGAYFIRSSAHRSYRRTGIARLEAMVNHPAGRGR
ncbi:hypothetical protein [Gordonia sp. (in: high G+C Gram-positive bacteria)]|uniref:hypothetical protein n=1 Tax=Gordonia sp. (in: high G+C Gram-positive bacteria) TaxID=84139 RepID=UPI003F946AA3